MPLAIMVGIKMEATVATAMVRMAAMDEVSQITVVVDHLRETPTLAGQQMPLRICLRISRPKLLSMASRPARVEAPREAIHRPCLKVTHPHHRAIHPEVRRLDRTAKAAAVAVMGVIAEAMEAAVEAMTTEDTVGRTITGAMVEDTTIGEVVAMGIVEAVVAGDTEKVLSVASDADAVPYALRDVREIRDRTL